MKRTMKIASAALVASSAFAGSVFAGSLSEPVIEPVMMEPVPVINTGGDWTGFYAGLQLGYGDADGPGVLDGDNGLYGFHAGYDYDFGQFVLGGELDYDQTNIDLNGGAATIDSVARAKIKGGYNIFTGPFRDNKENVILKDGESYNDGNLWTDMNYYVEGVTGKIPG